MMSRSTITQKLRRLRDQRDFERAVRTASPSMQQELLAIASRQRFN